ncbi:hypothetical protein GLYMA_13G063000v4 [Glycine max]|uniref:Uncharacterized protein n=1 Tax=Glycine max TaxID=3847 RepID=A0A0R0GJ33_SOYBN|nr:hypothetical protein JHK84_035861 [Glycine max]KAH1100093.1 hypothetical protein GYH30_035318 [Glycine max]KRH18476.1 hypothetical protein GLYMA_13G063000v4 [Glycine max]
MDLKAEATVGDVEFQAVKIPRQGGYRATYFIFGSYYKIISMLSVYIDPQSKIFLSFSLLT